MDRKILEDYIDACEYIRETRAEIARLKGRRRTVRDKVRGSNPDWPYEGRSFCLRERRKPRKNPPLWPGKKDCSRSR